MLLKINDRIRNRKVDFFDNFQLSLRYDSVGSAFTFGFYFNPENTEHKELACVGHYHECTVEHNDELLLTGLILSEGFSSAATRSMVAIGGYSMPGVLEDCQIPVSAYPLQFDTLSLREISKKVIAPFGLSMVVDPSVSKLMDEPYAKTTASATQTIKSYLTELAAQKNIIISHNEKGQLVFTTAQTKKTPIINFNVPQGETMPGTKFDLKFNGQSMHSHITVLKQQDKDGGNAGEFTIQNPYVPFVFRPRVIQQSSGTDIDTEKAAKNALADELRNLTLEIETDRWEVDGKILKPNNTITVINPEVYLYKKSTWFIEQIDFSGDKDSTTAKLKCVLPEVYNGQTPKYLFSGINRH